MAEYGNIDQALAGLQYGTNARVDSAIAQEIINFGAPVMGFDGDDGKCYNAHADLVTETLTGTFDASDTWSIVINGTTISVTFATTHTAMVTAMVAAINASAALIALGIVAEKSTDQIILIKSKGLDLTVTSSTGGGSSVTTADVTTSWAKFLGVALFAQRGGRDYGAGMAASNPAASGGTGWYDINSAVNIMNFGRCWVPVDGTVNSLDEAYAIYAAGATQGKFTASSSNTKNINSYFITSKNTQNLAVLEIRSIA